MRPLLSARFRWLKLAQVSASQTVRNEAPLIDILVTHHLYLGQFTKAFPDLDNQHSAIELLHTIS